MGWRGAGGSWLVPAALLAVATFAGCGDSSGPAGGRETSGPHERTVPAALRRMPPRNDRVITVEHLRRAVLRGLGRDFLAGTQVGPPSFGLCLQRGMRQSLTRRTLRTLALAYRRPAGQPFTAQALSRLAAPIGDRCGGRRFVPEMIDASNAFRAGRLAAAGIGSRLAYGPYLGVRCRKASSILCDRVGIDLVLHREAAAVTAWVGGRRVRLRTPGLHNGIAGRDWVGRLERVGLRQPGSPFHVEKDGGDPASWAGYPPVYVPVDLEIVYPRGRRVTGTLPRVSLSPGWG
jgi:hypothetical protein